MMIVIFGAFVLSLLFVLALWLLGYTWGKQ